MTLKINIVDDVVDLEVGGDFSSIMSSLTFAVNEVINEITGDNKVLKAMTIEALIKNLRGEL